MGLFVAEDGRYQGWLAALLCCVAAVNEDESPARRQRVQRVAPAHGQVCSKQPASLRAAPTMTSIWTMNAFKGDEPVLDGTRQNFRVPDDPPSISPLDFGGRAFIRGWPSDPNSTPQSTEKRRLSISAPHSFRRLDYTEQQKRALIPIRLAPVVLRDLPSMDDKTSPLESHYQLAQSPLNATPEVGSPVSKHGYVRENSQHHIASESPLQQQTPLSNRSKAGSFDETSSPRLGLSSRSSNSSLHRQVAHTPTSSITSRSSSERQRIRRKRSMPSMRKEGSDRLDQEILELNTIVEERRAETTRENLSEQHVAAVAPAMQIDARSETLTAIGSALSRPLANKSSFRDLSAVDTATRTAGRPPTQHSTTSSSSWSSSRLSGWLSGVLPTSASAQYTNGEPFYKCQSPHETPQRRTHSESSMSPFPSELESPALTTAASSPISRGHSRNLTDESRITSASPSTARTGGRSRQTSKADGEERWPLVVTPTEVGLAF